MEGIEAHNSERHGTGRRAENPGGGPLAKYRAASRANAVANGEDSVKAVVFDVAGDLSGTLGLNYPETPDSCLWRQFCLIIDVDQVLVDSLYRDAVQLGDDLLREPDGVAVEPHLQVGRTVGIDQEGAQTGLTVGPESTPAVITVRRTPLPKLGLLANAKLSCISAQLVP